jgi:hypothetical protein
LGHVTSEQDAFASVAVAEHGGEWGENGSRDEWDHPDRRCSAAADLVGEDQHGDPTAPLCSAGADEREFHPAQVWVTEYFPEYPGRLGEARERCQQNA